jgi:hypothetical protein
MNTLEILKTFLKDVAEIINRAFSKGDFLREYLHLFLPPMSIRVKEQSKGTDLEVMFKNLEGAQTHNVPFTYVLEGRVKLPDGIYPIVSTRYKISLLQNMKTRDDILVNMDLTVVADPSQKINFYTDRKLKNWPIKGIMDIVLRSPRILPFLVVKENRWEIEVLKPSSMFDVPLGVHLNINNFIPFGYKPLHIYYFLDELVFEVIKNFLWDKDKKPETILEELARKLWTYETLRATTILYNTISKIKENELEIIESIKEIVENINENPDYYPFPSSKDYVWVNYEDIISGKYKLQPKLYTITQYHYGKMFIEPPDDKIKPENSIVLDNSIVIYNMPINITMINYADGSWFVNNFFNLEKRFWHYWRINFLFPWPNGYMLIFTMFLGYNPYLEISSTLGKVIYIPEELSEFLLEISNNAEKDRSIEYETEKLQAENNKWLDLKLKIWRLKKENKALIKLKQDKVSIKIDRNPRIITEEEWKKETIKEYFKEGVIEGVITTLCWWPKYTQDAYLLPHIYAKGGFQYSWAKGRVHIFPKPIFLPDQKHVYEPEDIKKIISFGVFPVIRYYPYPLSKRKIVFAISKEEEVVLHYSEKFDKVQKNVSTKPDEMYGLDLIAVWKEFIQRYNVAKLNALWNNPNHRPSYWEGFDNDNTMFYLPEVLFYRLIGKTIEPKQEPFVDEIITNIQFSKHKEYAEWLEPIIAKYKNIPIYDNIKTITFSDLHTMPGAWFVLRWERKIGGDNTNNAMVIVNMRELSELFRVKIPWKILQITNSGEPTFITVWPDGTIGWWVLMPI